MSGPLNLFSPPLPPPPPSEAYHERNLSAFDVESTRLLEMTADLDALLATDPYWLAGTWTRAARAWGTTDAERANLEFNSRRQITLWGVDTSGLQGYAYKTWAGLVKEVCT